jgi:hypothetical protein
VLSTQPPASNVKVRHHAATPPGPSRNRLAEGADIQAESSRSAAERCRLEPGGNDGDGQKDRTEDDQR